MTSSFSPTAVWAARLKQLREDDLERHLRCLEGPAGPRGRFSDGERLVFCSNDYLGMANHPLIREALCEGAMRWGVGAGASRLVSGNMAAHAAVETKTAEWMGKQSAVAFVSGYQTNAAVLSTLVGEGDAIFSDELVHASLIDGARLSKASIQVFPHGDTAALARLLEENPGYKVRMIVTDSVFSMDGDRAPLVDIVEIARQHDVAVYVDEAHAVGVTGPRGAGVCAELGITDHVDVIVGTYSKAVGVSGGFAAADETVCALLRSRARGFLFSTGQPPATAAAVSKAVDLVKEADDLRQKLAANVATFREAASKCGLPLSNSLTAIQPVVIGPNARTMAVSEHLWQAGFFVQGIRPPTVKPGEARLRITLSAVHEAADILALVEAVRTAVDEVGE